MRARVVVQFFYKEQGDNIFMTRFMKMVLKNSTSNTLISP